jgi:uncharacterized damage-inducible protein DinB
LPSYAAIKERWQSQEGTLRRFVGGLTEVDLATPVEYTSRSGVPQRQLVWELVMQIINHSTQHRSEVALALTQAGHSPGFLDWLAYVQERDAG